MERNSLKERSNSDLFADISVLITLCRKHNLNVESILQQKEDGTELMRTNQRVSKILSKCLTDYGDLSFISPLKSVELLYVEIVKYEKKLQSLLAKGKLVRFITQARLRGKIDQLSNKICVHTEELEKSIREATMEYLVSGDADEFSFLLEEIEDEVRNLNTSTDSLPGSPRKDSNYTNPRTDSRASSLSSPAGPRKYNTLLSSSSSDMVSKIKDKEIKNKVDHFLSIVKDPIQREEILKEVGMFPVKPMTSDELTTRIVSGHYNDSTEHSFQDSLCGQSISTYPVLPQRSNTNPDAPPIYKREGDPICDMFGLSFYENRAVAVVADGCSWGDEPKEAARKASRMLLKYIDKHQALIRTTRDAGEYLLRAYHAAHKSIVQGRGEEDIFLAGTTTMLAGIVMEVEPHIYPQLGSLSSTFPPFVSQSNSGGLTGQKTPFVFVCCSIGDCKAYHYQARSGLFSEITKNNRGGFDVRDPGGRLGPYLDGGLPDLRNLKLFTVPCEANDILFIVSDGVHDNLDPKYAGKKPSELGLIVENDDWDKVEDDPTTKKIIGEFVENSLQSIIGKPVTVSTITKSLLANCEKLTRNIRDFMEQNPGKKCPLDYVEFPGKLDHSTCLSFKVGLRRSWKRASHDSKHLGTRGKPAENSSEIPTSSTPPSNSSSPGSFSEKWLNGTPSPVGTPTSLLGSGSFERSKEEKLIHDQLREEVFQELEFRSDHHVNNNSNYASSINNNNQADPSDTEPQRDIWNKLFGTEAYVIEWDKFISQLGIPLNDADKEQIRAIIDYSSTGSVTRYKFQEFLKGFGPLETCLENVKRVVSAPWFHGYLSGEESKKFMDLEPVGTFLVRFSGSRPGAFVIDFVRETGQVRSVRLNGHPEGGFAALVEGNQNQKVFKSLDDIVEIYAKMGVLKIPFVSKLTTRPWFFGDINAEEAEQLLAGQVLGTFLIRFSNQPGCFAASFVGANGSVLKGLITKKKNGFQVNNQGLEFPTLDELIAYYQHQKIFSTPLVQ